MSKSDLKAAMELLQVKKPLRLQARAPSFVPPVSDLVAATQVGNTTPDANPTPVENQPQVWKATRVENQTQVWNPTPVEKETQGAVSTQVAELTPVAFETQVDKTTPAGNPTQVGITTTVGNDTQVVNLTSVENPTLVANPTQVADEPPGVEGDSATLTRRATEQDSSVVLEARAADGLERGYTRLPNSVLMQLASGDFTRNEIKLALLVARFTISFQRKLAPLSKMVLERRSGLRGAAVLEGLSGLLAKGMIEKQQGDQHRPNMLGLVLPPDWDTLTKPKRETDPTPVGNQTPAANPTQVGIQTPVAIPTPVTNPTPAQVEKLTPAGVGNPTYFKDIKIYKNNSLSALPEPLQKYFGELKPAKKREGEWQAFESLQGDYPVEDISGCLVLLQERGIKRRGPNGEESQPCHSPMAYLSKAMGEIFGEVELGRQKARERIERERLDAEAAREYEATSAREAAEWALKERAFVEALPEVDRQHETIARLLGNLPIRPNSEVGRRMGIGLWWDARQSELSRTLKPPKAGAPMLGYQ
jgi:hypothetical protein